MSDSRWFVSIDGQQQAGDYGPDDVRNLIAQHRGKHILVWTQGMAQWADPSTLPQFQPAPRPAAAPAPQAAPAQAAAWQPAAQPGPAAAPHAGVRFDSNELKRSAGFFKSLLDISFTTFVTTKMVPVIYAIVMALLGLACVVYILFFGGGSLLAGIRFKNPMSIGMGIAFIALTPVVGVIYLALIRMWFELVIVFFRMKEDLDFLVGKAREMK